MTEPMSQTASQPVAAPSRGKAAILRAQGVKKTYKMGDEDLIVLKQIDLSLQPGEFVAIEGRSGSGKSTLLHILGALDAADDGTIEYEGSNIAAMGGNERSRLRNTQFGFVFQFYHLLPELSVVENALLGPMIENSWFGFKARQRELRERAHLVLSQLGLSHRLKHKPNQLSGGERQRVAIARALMNNPKILFADEPTGNLDFETGRQIMGVLEKLHREQGQTIVMVTHDRTLARQADRILVLVKGKLERPDSNPAADAAEV
jgi:lipoprotein-releasing system ATP-binding protein